MSLSFRIFLTWSPCQRNTPHIELIALRHPFGIMWELHQKFRIPPITEVSSCTLPAKERLLAVHEEIFSLTFWMRGAQLASDNFFECRAGEILAVKNVDFSGLMARPDIFLKSERT